MDAYVNFRSTAGYVTDGANQTYCLSDVYPTTRGGVTFGWESGGDTARDRNDTLDPRLAGSNFSNTVGHTFRLDLTATGDYNVYIAAGDAGSFCDCLWDLVDDASVFQSLTNPAGFLSPQEFRDASNVTRTTAADWVSNQVAFAHTFSSTILRVKIRAAATVGNDTLATVGVLSTGGGGATPQPIAAWCNNTNKVISCGLC